MNKKILFSVLTIALATTLCGTGIFAAFYDVETSKNNIVTAGTLDLKVNLVTDTAPSVDPTHWTDDPLYTINELFGMAADPSKPDINALEPGDSDSFDIYLYNAGTIDGVATIKVTDVVNTENDLLEPEKDVGDTWDTGELGAYLEVLVEYKENGIWSMSQDYIALNSLDEVEISLGGLAAGAQSEIEITFRIDSGVGNVIMSDRINFDIEIGLTQE